MMLVCCSRTRPEIGKAANYDKGNKRQVYIEQTATPEFWDSRWNEENFRESVKRREYYAISY